MAAKFTIESRLNTETGVTEFAVVRDGNLSNPETNWRTDASEIHGLLLDIRHRDVLHTAFSHLTANMANWKDPIAEVVSVSERAILEEAVPFFVGSVPTFEVLPGGKTMLVKAAGYYADIGS